MPRKYHRRKGAKQRRRIPPALRIARGPHTLPETSQPETPLDAVTTTQPTDLVQRSTSMSAADSVAAHAGAIDLGDDQAPSLEEYVRRIEQLAALSQVQRHGEREGEQRRALSISGVPAALPRRKRPPAEKKPWYRRRRTWILAATIVPLLFVVAASAYVLNIVRLSIDAYGDIHEDPVERQRWQVNPQGTPEPVPSSQVDAVLPNWDKDEPVNIILLGVDAREGEDLPPRSDTAIVVNVNPATNEVAMMSIPRDLLVYIPGFGEDKFNAAYPLGEANDDEIEGGGPTLVAQTIEANFDIPIHYYATIDFDGFEKVVDTVGGIMVDVQTQLMDDLYPTDDLRVTRIYFASGLQKMDGEMALQYVRTRHADSDFGRSERQQQVLMAIREQAISRDLITQAPQLIRNVQETVRTDLDFNQMLALANLGRGIDADAIAKLNLWEEGLLIEHLPEYQGDAYYVSARWDAVIAETQAFFGVPVSSATGAAVGGEDQEVDLSVSVVVQNGTDIPLLAGNSTRILHDAGFEDVLPSDASEIHIKSVIEAPQSQLGTARHIAELLGLPKSAIVSEGGRIGITVILGNDVPGELVPDPEQLAG